MKRISYGELKRRIEKIEWEKKFKESEEKREKEEK